MAEKTSLIAQHSEGVLVVDTNDIGPGIDVPAGRRIIQERGRDGDVALTFGNSLFRVEHSGDGSYRVISEFSGMVFDVAGASQASGAPIILWPWHGGPNQRFWLERPPVNNQAWGFYLQAQHSGKYLDVLGASAARGVPLVQWDFHGGPNQLFRVFGNPIKPVYSDMVLDVLNGSQANGAPIILWPLHGGPNQLFRLEYVHEALTGHQGERSSAYRIAANHGKVLDVEGASHENGAKLILWDWHGGANQLFTVRWADFAFSLFALHSRKAINVARASQDPGAQLIQWDYHGGLNQRFRL